MMDTSPVLERQRVGVHRKHTPLPKRQYLHLGYREEKPEQGATTQDGTRRFSVLTSASTSRHQHGPLFPAQAHLMTLEENSRTLVAACKSVGRSQPIALSNNLAVEKTNTSRTFCTLWQTESSRGHSNTSATVLSSRDGTRDRFHTDWHSKCAFRKLKQCVEYEAEQRGVFVDTVNPKNTSKRYTECGRDDTRHRDEFGVPAMRRAEAW
jgi:hypothetical protein